MPEATKAEAVPQMTEVQPLTAEQAEVIRTFTTRLDAARRHVHAAQLEEQAAIGALSQALRLIADKTWAFDELRFVLVRSVPAPAGSQSG